jgi:hypothetical protein
LNSFEISFKYLEVLKTYETSEILYLHLVPFKIISR